MPTYRRQMLDHCLAWAELGDTVYALYAASWFEKNNPWELHGLRARVERDIERMQAQGSLALSASARKP